MTSPADEARTRLADTIGEVQASDLAAHLRRGAVFVVEPSVPLVDAGVAIAIDDTAAVAAWIASGAVRRPTADEAARWLAASEGRWLAVVVQPYVLVQDLPIVRA
jgi:hypothetical protein